MNRKLAAGFDKRYGNVFFKKGIDVYLDDFELRLEKHLIDLLRDLNIHASVKTDRYSLPYTKEIIASAKVASYINDAFFHHNILKPAVKEILANGVNKLRFYITTDIAERDLKFTTTGLPDNILKKDSFTIRECSIVYKFRYFPHS